MQSSFSRIAVSKGLYRLALPSLRLLTTKFMNSQDDYKRGQQNPQTAEAEGQTHKGTHSAKLVCTTAAWALN